MRLNNWCCPMNINMFSQFRQLFITVVILTVVPIQVKSINLPISIKATPTAIVSSYDKTLTITCTVGALNTKVEDSYMSLVMTKKDPGKTTFYELASFSYDPKHAVVKSPQLKASVTGKLDKTKGGSMTLVFNYPTDINSGDYKCTVTFMDKNLMPYSQFKTAHVTNQTLLDLINSWKKDSTNKFHAIDTMINTLKANQALSKKDLAKLHTDFTNLKNSVNTHFSTLEKKVTTMTATIANLQKEEKASKASLATALSKLNALTASLNGQINKFKSLENSYNVFKACVMQPKTWTVIQKRFKGNFDFYRTWAEYKKGFGDKAHGDFWLGNDAIHKLTCGPRGAELTVTLKYKGKTATAHYSFFKVGDEHSGYVLSVGGFSGSAGDSLSKDHNGMKFSTKDKDYDKSKSNCATKYHGAWWYKDCHTSNLNGKWKAAADVGPRWASFTSSAAAEYTEMKVRPL